MKAGNHEQQAGRKNSPPSLLSAELQGSSLQEAVPASKAISEIEPAEEQSGSDCSSIKGSLASTLSGSLSHAASGMSHSLHRCSHNVVASHVCSAHILLLTP